MRIGLVLLHIAIVCLYCTSVSAQLCSANNCRTCTETLGCSWCDGQCVNSASSSSCIFRPTDCAGICLSSGDSISKDQLAMGCDTNLNQMEYDCGQIKTCSLCAVLSGFDLRCMWNATSSTCMQASDSPETQYCPELNPLSCAGCYLYGEQLNVQVNEILAQFPLAYPPPPAAAVLWESEQCVIDFDYGYDDLNLAEQCVQPSLGGNVVASIYNDLVTKVQPSVSGTLNIAAFIAYFVIAAEAILSVIGCIALISFSASNYGISHRLRKLLAMADIRPDILLRTPSIGEPLRRPKSSVGGFVTIALVVAVLGYGVTYFLTMNSFENVQVQYVEISAPADDNMPLVTSTFLLQGILCDDVIVDDAHQYMKCGQPGMFVDSMFCVVTMRQRVLPDMETLSFGMSFRPGVRFPSTFLSRHSSATVGPSVGVPSSEESWPLGCHENLISDLDSYQKLSSVAQFVMIDSATICTSPHCSTAPDNFQGTITLTIPDTTLIQQCHLSSILNSYSCALTYESSLTLARQSIQSSLSPTLVNNSSRLQLSVTIEPSVLSAQVNFNSVLGLGARVFGVLGSALALQPIIRQVLAFLGQYEAMRLIAVGIMFPFAPLISYFSSTYPLRTPFFIVGVLMDMSILGIDMLIDTYQMNGLTAFSWFYIFCIPFVPFLLSVALNVHAARQALVGQASDEATALSVQESLEDEKDRTEQTPDKVSTASEVIKGLLLSWIPAVGTSYSLFSSSSSLVRRLSSIIMLSIISLGLPLGLFFASYGTMPVHLRFPTLANIIPFICMVVCVVYVVVYARIYWEVMQNRSRANGTFRDVLIGFGFGLLLPIIAPFLFVFQSHRSRKILVGSCIALSAWLAVPFGLHVAKGFVMTDLAIFYGIPLILCAFLVPFSKHVVSDEEREPEARARFFLGALISCVPVLGNLFLLSGDWMSVGAGVGPILWSTGFVIYINLQTGGYAADDVFVVLWSLLITTMGFWILVLLPIFRSKPKEDAEEVIHLVNY